MPILRRMKLLIFAIQFVLLFAFTEPAKAQGVEHQLVRRLVVFPFQVGSENQVAQQGLQKQSLQNTADESWWQVREELAKSRRFLVASKQFLIKSDVYLPRGELQPADALILGKLLDAHALITAQLKNRTISMQAYDSGTGLVLWRKELVMHPSLRISDQLTESARKLVNDFIASFPYQGFTHVDPLIGKAVYEEANVQHAQIDVGINNRVTAGDMVQWVRINATNALPLFQGGAKVRVFAEGRVTRIDQGMATVEILRATKVSEIKEFSLIRIPREVERLQNELAIRDAVRGNLSPELVAPEANPMEQVTKERRPLVSTVSWLTSLATLLLLAL